MRIGEPKILRLFQHPLLRYERAFEVSARAVAANPEYGIIHLHLAISNALLGRRAEAQLALTNVMRLLPGTSVGSLRARVMSRHPAYVTGMERGYAALQSIGLPD